MITKLQKFTNNIISQRAVSVLGIKLYLHYVANLIIQMPKILQYGDLRYLDKVMGSSAKRFYYRNSAFIFDCQFCDEHLEEDSFAFGLAREIYIRDCYFKWHPSFVYENAKTVVDLGANRVAFSALMTNQADLIVSVECSEQYAPIISHNLNGNSFSNYFIETAFIGEGGEVDSDLPTITIQELLKQHGIKSVDFMKLDIEGSEFSLFTSDDWLQYINAISMEIHPKHGNPNMIVQAISKHGFSYVIADDDLQQVDDPNCANYIYAWKDKHTKHDHSLD